MCDYLHLDTDSQLLLLSYTLFHFILTTEVIINFILHSVKARNYAQVF